MRRFSYPIAALVLSLGASSVAGCESSRELDQQPVTLATAAATERAQRLPVRATPPIYDALHDELGAAVHDLDITERNGLVELRGVMPSLWHEERALLVATADDQVRAVVDAMDVALLAVDDADLAKDVMAKIAGTPATEPWDLDVIAYAGHVWLAGVVDSPTEHAMAISAAKRVPGVLAVHDWLLSRVPATRPDEEILADALAVLEENPFIDEEHLWVDIEDGEASVFGAVTELGGAAAVAKQLHALAGIDAVEASVIELPPRPSAPRVDPVVLDRELTAEAVVFALEEAGLATAVVVATAPGEVELRGAVDTLHDVTRATRIAASVVGVDEVTSFLKTRFETPLPLEAEVASRLADVGLADDIEVSLDGRVATLEGYVDTGFERVVARRAARGHRGVVEVIDDVAIRTRPALRSATFER